MNSDFKKWRGVNTNGIHTMHANVLLKFQQVCLCHGIHFMWQAGPVPKQSLDKQVGLMYLILTLVIILILSCHYSVCVLFINQTWIGTVVFFPTVIVVAVIGAVGILVIVAVATVLIIWKCRKNVSALSAFFDGFHLLNRKEMFHFDASCIYCAHSHNQDIWK